MKKLLATLLAFSLVLVVGMAVVHAADKPEGAKVLRHVVLFKFKADATPEQVKSVEEAFAAMKGKLPLIQDFEWGTDVSTENLQQGFTHCFFVTFKSEADRDAYLPHPVHKEFVKLAGTCLEKALVVDYWARD
ncbi:MAG: Dabb family protein [Candidatus Hydrogenedentes bacterium]|nr:Dabb family protein [Candidatus Hydrogenedentota bacterium]